ncbi:MAG: NADP-dependent oxidoreductase [Actinobacteria bacterium]|nr:NADP-dependent oxidoreductase [Actinomycetota bacterium]
MRAVTITRPGGPEVLDVADLPAPDPRPGEVRIAVRAAAVHPTDSVTRENGVADVPPPWIPGMDLAGEVESVGAGVERPSVGDRVMAAVNARRPGGGAQAELVVAPAASVVSLPAGLGFAPASTLPMNGLTARLGLEALALEPGQTLAVSGGAGLLASYVIAMARERGLTVIADAAPGDAASVEAAGCAVVIPRGDDFAGAVRAVAPAGVDGLYDTAALAAAALGAIRDGGAMVSIRGWTPDEPERGITVTAIGVVTALERTDWLEEIRDLAASGRLVPPPIEEIRPEGVARAQGALDAGGLRRRSVIVF